MDARGIAARIYDLPAAPRRLVIGIFLLVSVGVGWLSLLVMTPGTPSAFWWPAIAVGFVAVLASRGRRIAVCVGFATAVVVANLLSGLPVTLALAYGLANAIELWILVRLLTRGDAHVDFLSLRNAGRFLLSIGVASTTFAIVGAGSAALLAGADFGLVALSLATSHASALCAIAPLFLVPLVGHRRVAPWEPVAQIGSLALLTVVVFAPAASLALTFLIVTMLMWGAFRLPPVVTAAQTFALALVATSATGLGIGPFAVLLSNDVLGALFALKIFILTHAAAALFVSGQSADWHNTTAALAAREREATRVADDLVELSRQKDDFIASVSHELRTPVTSILGFAEQLTDSDSETESRQAGRIIFRNARRLADVIEDVLELSQLSSAEATTRPPVGVDLRRVLTECVEDATGLATPGRDVFVDLRVPPGPVMVLGVERDFTRVCANLMSNAVKFSPAGGTITVQLIDDGDTIELRFSDEGPGVPVAEQEAVWERFYRVQSPRHNDVPGTGLGLPIVRALVRQRIGGEVELHSDGERGTTVVVSIRRTPASTALSGLETPTPHETGA